MFIINLYRFFRGYVNLIINGELKERILNLCAINKISVFNIVSKDDVLKFSVLAKDFLNFRAVRAGNNIKIHIIKKCGLPFILRKYTKRIGIIVGLAVFFAILQLLSSYIWNIEVVGNKTVPANEIIGLCETLGIKEGVKSNKIDSSILREMLLQKTNKLSWASFNVEGTKLTVNVTETLPLAEKQPSNIKSNFKGTICDLVVTSGVAEVKIGQTVNVGDILISGIIEKENGTDFKRAGGKITAIVEKTFDNEQNYVQKIKYYSEHTVYKKGISIFGLKIPLFLGKYSGDFECKYNEKYLKFLNKNMPVKIYEKIIKPYKIKYADCTEETVKNILNANIEQQIANEKITDYSVLSTEYYNYPDKIKQITVINYKTQIGVEEKILFDTLKF